MAGRRKVFGIGFHKTATSSLGKALELLGYRVAQGFGFEASDIEESIVGRAIEIAGRHDGFEDNPWPILYKEMDEAFPGSKFVATWRDPEAWFTSVERHFGRDSTQMREWIYGRGNGSPLGKREIYVKRYLQHYDEVSAYFKRRPDDFLRLDLSAGLRWQELCEFLEVSEPDVAFPMSNVGAAKRGAFKSAIRQSRLGSAIRKIVNRRRSNWT